MRQDQRRWQLHIHIVARCKTDPLWREKLGVADMG
jgi:hypothetical protein